LKQTSNLNRLSFAGILGLTLAAFLIHGYHPWSEDAEIYMPGIEKILNPHLFPVGADYFQLHAHMTWFPQLIAGSVRLTHLPFSAVIFLWQIASFFLFLTACWQLLCRLFPGVEARWAGVALITALFTLPIAGTALYLMDPFLNPRNIIAFAQVYAVLRVLERKYLQAALFLVFSISIHPFMSAFACSFCLLLFVVDRLDLARWPWRRNSRSRTRVEEAVQVAALAAPVALPSGNPFARLLSQPTAAYDQVAASHSYQFLARWAWYEILGAIAPVFLLSWFSAVANSRGWRSLQILCRALAIYGAIYFAAGLIISLPRRLEVLSLLQPMRSLYLLYVLMLLVGGGLLGEYVLRLRAWRWIALFLPLCGGMAYAQRALYPQSQHIELPGVAPSNPWEAAFLWIRKNTPEDAVFAIDPEYMRHDDQDGFRAIAARSHLADDVKDSGVVEMFPVLGDRWLTEKNAQMGIDHFTPQQFAGLKERFQVTWAVLNHDSTVLSDCPYSNAAVKVCRLP
jgi:hypothetical protein